MDWWQRSNDKLGMGAARLLGTLNHLNCAIHIMTNLVSITERANLMTSGGLKGGGAETQRTDTKLPAAHQICFKAAWSGCGLDDPLYSRRRWHANCTLKEYKYYRTLPLAGHVGRSSSLRRRTAHPPPLHPNTCGARRSQTALENIVFISKVQDAPPRYGAGDIHFSNGKCSALALFKRLKP